MTPRQPEDVVARERAGIPTRDDLADTLCYLRRHDDHPEERHCPPSWNEADRIIRCLSALNESRRNRAPTPSRIFSSRARETEP